MKTKFNQIITSLFLMFAAFTFAQQSISGTVTDESGVPLPGSTIIVSSSGNATTTDFDGNFSIVASIDDVLQVSYVGYSQKEVQITSSQLDVMLEEGVTKQ